MKGKNEKILALAELQVFSGAFANHLLILESQEKDSSSLKQALLAILFSGVLISFDSDTLKIITRSKVIRSLLHSFEFTQIKVFTPHNHKALGAKESFFLEEIIFKMDPSSWWSSTLGLQTRKMLHYLVLKKQRVKKSKVKVRKRRQSSFVERFFRRFFKTRK